MKRKIVILGATGTVGSKISENLLNEGHQVTVIARNTDKQIFLGNGFSEDFADNLLGMAIGIKEGIFNYQKRSEYTTTPTTAEEFAEEAYAVVYNK